MYLAELLKEFPLWKKIKGVFVSNFDRYQNVPNDPVFIKRARRVTAKQLAKEKNISLPKAEEIPLPVSTN